MAYADNITFDGIIQEVANRAYNIGASAECDGIINLLTEAGEMSAVNVIKTKLEEVKAQNQQANS